MIASDVLNRARRELGDPSFTRIVVTGTQVVDRARRILADTVTTYRWSDAILLDILNDGVREIWERRADSRYSTSGVLQTSYTEIASLGSNLAVLSPWRDALVEWVCWRAFAMDADDQENMGRAKYHGTEFQRQVETLPRRLYDVELLDLLNDGMREIWQRRADARFTSAGAYTTGGFTEATATGDTLDLLNPWREPLVSYVCYRASEMVDGPDNMSRSQRYLGLFEKGIKII